ncbi:MAG: hypothetical protein P1U63_13170 [Coxiellaceae bacterium]|nr:hypothetical protein [Coxiellaceae bacterium]
MRGRQNYRAGKKLDPAKLAEGRESFPSTPTDPEIDTRYRFDFAAAAAKIAEMKSAQENPRFLSGGEVMVDEGKGPSAASSCEA